MNGCWPERFTNKFSVAVDCWIWRGGTTVGGYGVWWWPEKQRLVMAHRVAWELTNGAIPAGLVIDHLCRERSCVNPAHLRVTTHRDNILSGVGVTARNAVKTHCPSGHSYTIYGYRDSQDRRRCAVCRPSSRWAP